MERIQQAAAPSLGGEPSAVLVAELAPRLPWVRRHGVFTARLRGTVEEVAVLVGFTSTYVAHGDERLPALNRLLRVEGVILPDELTPAQLADAVLICMAGARNVVASRALLARPGALVAWTRSRPESSRMLLRRLCEGPHVTKLAGRWRLAFHALEPTGAVSAWDVRGTPEMVVSVVSHLELPAGTFRYPFV